MSIYLVKNAVMPTTAAAVAVTTGTTIKTLLQVKPLINLRVIEWGISFDAAALAAPIRVELIETGTVFATVTTLAEGDVDKLDDPNALAATVMAFGTSATGFTASAEGTITAVRYLDPPQFISVLSQPFRVWIPLKSESRLTINNSARIRVTAAAAVNAYAWMRLEG